MIDRDKAIEILSQYKNHYFGDKTFGGKISIGEVVELLKVQEPVRCKDCKWLDKKDGSPYGYCHACKHGHYSEHWEIGIYRTYKGDWFCADGERKEGR